MPKKNNKTNQIQDPICEVISLHTTKKEKKELLKLKKEYGYKSLSPFLKYLLFKNKKDLKNIPPEAQEIKLQLKKIGGNINQISYNINSLKFKNNNNLGEKTLQNIDETLLKYKEELNNIKIKIENYFTC